MTTRAVELGGVTLPEGAHLLLLYASANDDENEFECPREFNMERTNFGRHMSFGGGVHRCAGAPLARMELKVAAREVIGRLDDIRLAIPEDEIEFNPTIAARQMMKLPVAFRRKE